MASRRVLTFLIADDTEADAFFVGACVLAQAARHFGGKIVKDAVIRDRRPVVQVVRVTSPHGALANARSGIFDAILVDFRWAGEPLGFWTSVRDAAPSGTPVFLVSGYTETPVSHGARAAFVRKDLPSISKAVERVFASPPVRSKILRTSGQFLREILGVGA
tara:strand:- start:559 stop:1044 length:486 start_codon:yes stop_codon:yes gene_type:complete